MKTRSTLIALAIGILASESALACRYNAHASERIRMLAADMIVLARIEHAAYDGPRARDWHAWSGVAAVERVLIGHTTAERFTIGRSGSTAACDDGIGPPTPGASWVLYLRGGDGSARSALSYPLSVARDADPAWSESIFEAR